MSKSGMTWFRFYSDWRTNPKVKLLHETFQLRFIDLMCLRCEGEIPGASDDEISYHLRVTIDEWSDTKKVLENAGLWADGDICKWDKRQYKSDNSTSRVKRHRKRFSNVTVTPSESESDTDTEGEGKKPAPPSKLKWAQDLRRKHGLQPVKNMTATEADEIIDELKDLPVPDPAKLETERKNAELRRLKEILGGVAQMGERDPRNWIDDQSPEYRNALLVELAGREGTKA